jgi:glyoxylase-like metal-dependent hydrolase (beta-lactamase superfamily II)
MTITPIDLQFQDHPRCTASYLVESGGERALIECGPGSATPRLTEGLDQLGCKAADISKVLLTHVHLDHAGAAGWWARQGAQIYVHERGARHLADPTKLIQGARMVYGDSLESLWGEILPVPADHLTCLQDGDTVTVGSTTLTAWDTPGHARHHHCYVTDGFAFTGDVAGMRLPDETYISPTTAPSQFDPEAYRASLQRLLDGGFDTLYLTHFGPVTDVADHLQRYRQLIAEVSELVRLHLDHPVEIFTAHNRERAEAEGVSREHWALYELGNPCAMCAAGIQLYWQKRNAQAVSSAAERSSTTPGETNSREGR